MIDSAIDAAGFTRGHERGEIRALARMITLAENDPHSAYRILGEAGLDPRESHLIGITGPPGVGKSSLANAMAVEIRRRDESVAIMAIDPSSPFRGGALLGDRIRMNAHAGDPGVYIRSMAARGLLGGLSRAAWIGARVLATWGFDWIIVETAGVGQSEIDVVDLADTTVLVVAPGLGDDVQVMKAGIMEVADVLVVNKSDMPGVERVCSSLVSVLGAADSDTGVEARPEIYRTTANTTDPSNGVPELIAGLIARADTLAAGDKHSDPQGRRTRMEIRRETLGLLGKLVDEALDRSMAADGKAADDGMAADPMTEAQRIVAELIGYHDNRGQAAPDEENER